MSSRPIAPRTKVATVSNRYIREGPIPEGGAFQVSNPARMAAFGEGSSPSLTYEPYYGLREKPFSLSSDPRFLYTGPSHVRAFEQLLAGIKRREGLIVLSGEIG